MSARQYGTKGFRNIHPTKDARRPFKSDVGDNPRVMRRCGQCGFICDVERDARCPFCGSDNYLYRSIG